MLRLRCRCCLPKRVGNASVAKRSTAPNHSSASRELSSRCEILTTPVQLLVDNHGRRHLFVAVDARPTSILTAGSFKVICSGISR
jgi:hypothetical protein